MSKYQKMMQRAIRILRDLGPTCEAREAVDRLTRDPAMAAWLFDEAGMQLGYW
jgi:hypothetical protein